MASTYLTRTPASAGNRKTWTWSSWCKFSQNANIDTLLSTGADSSNRTKIIRNNVQNGDIRFLYSVSAVQYDLVTSALYRDNSAWYHIVVAVDTTQATSSDRVKIYINGEQITSFSTANYLPQNTDTDINTTNTHYIGRYSYSATNYMNGSMAHVHFIDGTQYQASDFGETDSTTGIWKPKTAPSVTYGTNGFFLKFENSGSMGTDSSGNGNNFTVNGTMTQTIDTPSNVFATWNPLFPLAQYGTYTNGNTSAVGNNNTFGSRTNSTLAVSSGKYYMEFKIIDVQGSSYPGVGMISTDNAIADGQVGGATNSVSYRPGGTILTDGSVTATVNTFTDNDIIGIAMDLDNGAVYFSKNGTWQNSGDPTSGSSKTGSLYSFTPSDTYHFACTLYTVDAEVSANFGNGYFGTTAVSSAQNPDDGIGIFEYAVPTGYKALCTKSINAQEYD